MNEFKLNHSQVFTEALHNPNDILSVPLQHLGADNPNQHEQIATIMTDKPKDRNHRSNSFSTSPSPNKNSQI